MESKELLAYYNQYQEIISSIYQPKTDNELQRFLIYIVDTEKEKNYPLLAPFPADIVFNTTVDLKKVLTQLFKASPNQTDKGSKIINIFQIHLLLVSKNEKESFIAVAESIKATGFFNKLKGKSSVELWMFWGNLLEQKLNAILEDDQRFRKLVIRNYYREAEEIFYAKTEYKKVEEMLVRCLDLAPEDPDSLILMGRCKLFLSEFEAAEDIFNKVTNINSKNERAWYGLATAQLEIFKMNPKKEHVAYLDAAERNADKGLAINPKNVELINLKSGVALLKMDTQKSVNLLREALSLRPDDANTNKNLALALLASGQFSEALNILEKISSQKPNDETIVHRIIQCHFELKNDEKAKSMINEWKHKARNQAWLQSLEMTYMVEIPEEFQNENSIPKDT